MSNSIEHQRTAEGHAAGHGFRSLLEHLSAKRCISMILKRTFGEGTHRCCGGCRWCRKEGRDARVAPVFEYDVRTRSRNVRVVENCPHPISSAPRSFVSSVRNLHESGIRRFACSSTVFPHLLELFSVALDGKDLFRLDAIVEGMELFHGEALVVFHTETPTRNSVTISGASQVTHVLCGDLRFHDIRYLLELIGEPVEYFPHLSLLT